MRGVFALLPEKGAEIVRGLVLFDLDGTLADSAPGLAHSANVLRTRRGLAPLPYEALREHCGSGAAGLIWAGLRMPKSAESFESTKAEFLENYAEIMVPYSTLFEGVPEMLAELTRRGLTWGIVTNKVIELARPLCEAKGIASGAGIILSGQTFGAPKPAPDTLLHAMSELGFTARETLYVGDDARDAQAAANAGVGFIAAIWGYTGSGRAVDQWGALALPSHVPELPDLAEKFLAVNRPQAL